MAWAEGRLPELDFRWLFRTSAILSTKVDRVQGGECELKRTGIGRIDETRRREVDRTSGAGRETLSELELAMVDTCLTLPAYLKDDSTHFMK